MAGVLNRACVQIRNILQDDARLVGVNNRDIIIGAEDDIERMAHKLGFPCLIVIPGGEEIEPLTVKKDQRTATIYVLCAVKDYDKKAVGIALLWALAENVYDALMDKKTLNAQVKRSYIEEQSYTYLTRKNAVLYFSLFTIKAMDIDQNVG